MRVPQLFYEVIWDTAQFNNKADWPDDGTQPFVWSFGDGYALLASYNPYTPSKRSHQSPYIMMTPN